MKRVSSVLLCATLLLSLAAPAHAAAAAQEAETAGAYLSGKRILLGDATGDLKLDKGLTRAELAAILTRLNGGGEDVATDPAYYAGMCYFIDVPEWAKPYVGYCADSYLMNGYDLFHFGAEDAVSPGMASTVTLRYLAVPETDWNYSTALVKASGLGLSPAQGMEGDTITRGNMSILLYRALTQGTSGGTAPAPTGATPAGSAKDHPKVLDGGDWAREDFSQQANPVIFDGVYTREAYNAARQTIVDRETVLAGVNDKGYNPSYTYGYTTASAETRRVMDQILARFSEYHDYATGVEPYLEGIYNYPDYFICKVHYHAASEEAVAALADTLTELRAMSSDTERMRRINDIVCDKLTYHEKGSSTPNIVFASDGVFQGKCTSYSQAINFLCDLVGIPCIEVLSSNHNWNAVYVNGRWSFIDAVVNDVGDELNPRSDAFLVDSFPDPSHIDAYPEITAFAKELLVPGSTR